MLHISNFGDMVTLNSDICRINFLKRAYGLHAGVYFEQRADNADNAFALCTELAAACGLAKAL